MSSATFSLSAPLLDLSTDGEPTDRRSPPRAGKDTCFVKCERQFNLHKVQLSGLRRVKSSQLRNTAGSERFTLPGSALKK